MLMLTSTPMLAKSVRLRSELDHRAVGVGCGGPEADPVTEIQPHRRPATGGLRAGPAVVTAWSAADLRGGGHLLPRDLQRQRPDLRDLPPAAQLHDRRAVRAEPEGQNPNDPLFVAETNPALATLETPFLEQNGGVLENVDGFEDPRTSSSCDRCRTCCRWRPASPPIPATARPSRPTIASAGAATARPATGRCARSSPARSRSTTRRRWRACPASTSACRRRRSWTLTLAFQMSLGRLNELDITQVNLFDTEANTGRQAFLDPAARPLQRLPHQRRRELHRHGQEPQLRHQHARRDRWPAWARSTACRFRRRFRRSGIGAPQLRRARGSASTTHSATARSARRR